MLNSLRGCKSGFPLVRLAIGTETGNRNGNGKIITWACAVW